MNPISQPVNPNPNARSEEQTQHAKAMEAIQLAHRQKILAVFNSAEGDMLLDMWDDIFVRQPVIKCGDTEGRNEMREGRNDFVRMIRSCVNTARGEK
tara:strand:- start:967 stop:1257 length:291 start_codon:yes stop_codon:yes gene_type:complete